MSILVVDLRAEIITWWVTSAYPILTQKRNGAVIGAERVKRQKHTDGPRTREAQTSELNPCIATGGDIPLMKAQTVILKDWRNARRDALEQWRVDKTTVFPLGTWMHVVVHGAAAA